LGTEVEIAGSAFQPSHAVVGAMGQGHTILLIPDNRELTTTPDCMALRVDAARDVLGDVLLTPAAQWYP
jgi:hypothetical protein